MQNAVKRHIEKQIYDYLNTTAKEYKSDIKLNTLNLPIKKGEDVTLNGYFMLIDSNNNEKYPVSKGLSVAVYLNHIN